MDPTSLATLLQTFQDMAKSNQELVAAVQAGAAATTAAATTAAATAADGTRTAPMQDTAGAVALTNIKLPLDMGDSAEERLVNFDEWKEEI